MKTRRGLSLIKEKNKYLIEQYKGMDERSVGELLIEISDIPIAELAELFRGMKYEDYEYYLEHKDGDDYCEYVEYALIPTLEKADILVSDKCSSIQSRLIYWDLYYYILNYLASSPLFERTVHNDMLASELLDFHLKEDSEPDVEVPHMIIGYFSKYLYDNIRKYQGILDELAHSKLNALKNSGDFYGDDENKQHIEYFLQYDNGKYLSVYNLPTLNAAVAFELANIPESNVLIKKCEICGKFFIPANRADTKYCDRISPDDKDRTCKQYGRERLWYKNLMEDDVIKLSRSINSAKSMRVKRNPDNPKYKEGLDRFRQEDKQWRNNLKAGFVTEQEYKDWLLVEKEKGI